jgi:hypothetical protein
MAAHEADRFPSITDADLDDSLYELLLFKGKLFLLAVFDL